MNESSDTTRSQHRRRLRRRPLGRYRYVRLRWRVLFAIIDFLGERIFGIARVIRRFATAKNVAEPRVVLLVQLDHLGDAIISTAMLPALRRRYPNARIEVLASPWNREVFEAAPEVDRVLVCGANRFARGSLRRFAWMAAVLWWGWVLRRRKVDLGIDVRGDFPVAVILWLSRAKRRLGWGCAGGGFLLTDRATYVPDRPEVDSRMALLRELGIEPATEKPRFYPTETARWSVAQRLAEHSPAGSDPCIVLHVGAGTTAKQWPTRHWRELLGRLVVELGVEVVLVGGRSDRIIARDVLGEKPWPGVTDWTGRLSVMELAALLQRADVFVGADSGPAHLAAAVSTPVVVLFSGTNNPRQWRPHGGQVAVVRHPVECSPCHRERCPVAGHPCLDGVRADRVLAEIRRALPAGADSNFNVRLNEEGIKR